MQSFSCIRKGVYGRNVFPLWCLISEKTQPKQREFFFIKLNYIF